MSADVMDAYCVSNFTCRTSTPICRNKTTERVSEVADCRMCISECTGCIFGADRDAATIVKVAETASSAGRVIAANVQVFLFSLPLQVNLFESL